MPLRLSFNERKRGMEADLLLTGIVLIVALRATTRRR